MPQNHRMSPELRQVPVLSQQARMTLYILQMPLLELRGFLVRELCENPVLEETDNEEKDPVEGLEAMEDAENEYPDPQHPGNYVGGDEEKRRYVEALITKEETFEDHLLWQLGMFLDGRQYEIGEYIIRNLDENGYFRLNIDKLRKKFNVERSEADEILSLIQTFDPAGSGARDLRECLLLQLRAHGKEDSAAYKIVDSYIEFLEEGDYRRIAKKLKIGLEEVENACHVINALEPKPGRAYNTDRTVSIIPDVVLTEEQGVLNVELNNRYTPVLFLSRYYSRLLKSKKTDEGTKEYLNQRYQRARWIINAISQRQDTIKNVSEFIVNFQRDFLEDAQGKIRPLKLSDAAKKLSISESTVSRAVAGKYIQTDMGTFPLKKFFSSGIKQKEGEAISSDHIKNSIKELIASEETKNPLKDQEIVDLLKNKGIDIARRTVTKYRRTLKIPPAYSRNKSMSSLRKQGSDKNE